MFQNHFKIVIYPPRTFIHYILGKLESNSHPKTQRFSVHVENFLGALRRAQAPVLQTRGRGPPTGLRPGTRGGAPKPPHRPGWEGARNPLLRALQETQTTLKREKRLSAHRALQSRVTSGESVISDPLKGALPHFFIILNRKESHRSQFSEQRQPCMGGGGHDDPTRMPQPGSRAWGVPDHQHGGWLNAL